jgi:hypothetical protein
MIDAESVVSISAPPPPDFRGVKTFAVAQVPLQTLRTCLEIEDQSKERLNCYDENNASTETGFWSSQDSARLPL